MKVTMQKSMSKPVELVSIVKKLESAIKLQDSFSVSILTTRLINMGYKLECEYDKN